MIDPLRLQGLNRRTHRLLLDLAINGTLAAKHIYARDRAMRPYTLTYMLKSTVDIDYRVVAQRAKWIYDRLVRLEMKRRRRCQES